MKDSAVISSVCGAMLITIDSSETNLDVTCCDNCKSILICRNAWNHLYGKGGK